MSFCLEVAIASRDMFKRFIPVSMSTSDKKSGKSRFLFDGLSRGVIEHIQMGH